MSIANLMKFPRTPYLPFSPSIPEGESTRGLDRVMSTVDRLVGTDVVVTEKLDGACTLLHDGLAFNGRSPDAPSTAPWHAMVQRFHAWKTGQHHPMLQGQQWLLYGEDIYGLHSIAYEPVPVHRTFYAFALRVGAYGWWSSWDYMVQVCELIGIPVVPVLFRGTFPSAKALEDFVTECHRWPSVLGGESEGVVVRRTELIRPTDFSHKVGKSVRANHVQSEEHWSHNWKPCSLLPGIPVGYSDDF